MLVISTREFRSNQGNVLIRAINGEDVVLTSRYGAFRLTPVSQEDKIIPRMKERANRWISDIKDIENGKSEFLTEEEFWNDL